MSSTAQWLSPRNIMPASKTQLPSVQRLTPRHVLGATQEEAIPDTTLRSVLGKHAEGGHEISLSDVERRNGLYVLGKPGMGKTTLLINLALQDMKHGHGVFFLDPHGDGIEDILARLPEGRENDVILLNPESDTDSFCINLLACEDITSLKAYSRTYARAYAIFHKLFADEETGRLSPWLHKILSNTLYAFIENQRYGYTLAHVPDFLTDAAFRREMVRNITENREVARFWQKEFEGLLSARDQREQVQATLDRIRDLLVHRYVKHVIGYPQSTIDFGKIMAEKKIVLAVFSENLSEDIQEFLGTIVVSELLKAARDRADISRSQRHQFCVFVDEFQNYATPDFAKFITGARKYGIAMTIAHQERYGQLGTLREVLGATLAAAHRIVYQLSEYDAEVVAKVFADRPEPAWLQVLSEEERIVDEKEDLQRIVDVVKNGVEPILTLAQQPLTHLLRAHSNPEVNRLTAGVLQRLNNALQLAQAETEQASPFEKASPEPVFSHSPKGSSMEFHATREQMLEGKQEINQLLLDLEQGSSNYGSQEMVKRLVAIVTLLRGLIGFSQGAEWFTKTETISWTTTRFSRSGPYQEAHFKDASAGGWKDTPLRSWIAQLLPEIVAAAVRESSEALQEENPLLSLAELHKTQQVFEQTWLLYRWQETKEERDKQVLTNKDLIPYKNGLVEEYDEMKLLAEKALQQRNMKDYYCDDSGPGRVNYKREKEALSERWRLLPEGHPMATELSIQRYYLTREQESRESSLKDALLKAEIAESEKLFQLMRNDESTMKNHPAPQTIEELLTPPSGLSQYARSLWIETQEQELSKLMPVAQAEYRRLADFLTGLCAIFLSHCVPEQQEMEFSSQFRPREEERFTYILRPEKSHTKAARTLPHPQRGYPDMVAEKQHDLLNLAPYTAYYKLTGIHETDKGKLIGQPLPLPLDPYMRTLVKRHIQKLNLRTYYINRKLIEEAIRKRQQQQDQDQSRKEDERAPSRYA